VYWGKKGWNQAFFELLSCDWVQEICKNLLFSPKKRFLQLSLFQTADNKKFQDFHVSWANFHPF
jgi:hypothetical protein